MSSCASCIKSFVITEKSVFLRNMNKAVVNITNKADKASVAKAFFDIFGAKVCCVHIITPKVKPVRKGRNKGFKKCPKRAIITVAKGFDINSLYID